MSGYRGATKRCGWCGKSKPATAEFFYRSSAEGFQSRCKDCAYETHRAWQSRHFTKNQQKEEARAALAAQGFKRCTKCGEAKPGTVEFFNLAADQKSGLRPNCKACDRARAEKYEPPPITAEIAAHKRAVAAAWKKENPDKVAATVARHEAKLKAKRAEVHAALDPVLCSVCSRPFRPKRERGRFCSDACRQKGQGRATVERACDHCGKLFLPRNAGSKDQRYCGHACRYATIGPKLRVHADNREGSTARSRVRRARLAGAEYEAVDKMKVFEAAGWICYLCGGKTNPAGLGSMDYRDDTPSLDHKIPLSRGGAHTYANSACAHRLCNYRKRDMTEEEYRQRYGEIPQQ